MRWILALSIAVCSLAPLASACWMYVAPEVLADEADLAVIGTVFALEAGPGDNEQHALLRIQKVLKDLQPPAEGTPPRSTVRIVQVAVVKLSASLRYKVGTRGVFLLRRAGKAKDTYRVYHPGCHIADARKGAEIVGKRLALAGGPIVNGLQLRAETVPYATKTGRGFYLRLSVKNTTDAPITLATRKMDRPIRLDWTTPAGKASSKHYGFLASRGRSTANVDSEVIPAGGVRFVGPGGRYSRVLFSTNARGDANPLARGTHRVKAILHSDGAHKAGSWKGTLGAPVVSHTVE